jgi:pimeloyl-ACP methyl ester carboxylesterase
MEIPVQFGLRRGESRGTPRFRKLLEETSVSRDFRDPAGLTEDRLAHIHPPALAVYGDISPFRNVARRLVEALPNCAGMEIPGVGHFFLLHAPDLFLDSVQPVQCGPSPAAATEGGAPHAPQDQIERSRP